VERCPGADPEDIPSSSIPSFSGFKAPRFKGCTLAADSDLILSRALQFWHNPKSEFFSFIKLGRSSAKEIVCDLLLMARYGREIVGGSLLRPSK
jgi:hypothetical protein